MAFQVMEEGAAMFNAGWMQRSVARATAGAIVAAVIAGSAHAACVAERADAMVATDPALCRSLAAAIRKPAALPLAEYEARLDQFFGHYCHRDAAAGWVP